MTNCKAFGSMRSWPFRVTTLAHACKNWDKQQKFQSA